MSANFAASANRAVSACRRRCSAISYSADPTLAAELAMRTAMHLTQVGVEELRRWELQDTGIWIFDDMAATKGPMFSPATAERVLAPAWDYMVKAYREAGYAVFRPMVARRVAQQMTGRAVPELLEPGAVRRRMAVVVEVSEEKKETADDPADRPEEAAE